MRHSHGFSVVELMIAMTLVLGVMAGAFAVLNPSGSIFTTQTEAVDTQQRIRVAADALQQDLAMAGSGPSLGARYGPLNDFFAPVTPDGFGAHGGSPGTVTTGGITIRYVPRSGAQATIDAPFSARSGVASIQTGTACPSAGSVCGFSPPMSVVVYDETGSHDLFSVTRVDGTSLHLRHESVDSEHLYPAGSPIVEVVNRAYFLKQDTASGVSQLVRHDAGGSDVPVVDHVVGLAFEYFADPQPPRLLTALSEPQPPWTTYGPKPPPIDVRTTTYPPGENCVFINVGTIMPRLGPLGSAEAPLVKLTPDQLTDGPWCPDALHPNRFDADLLRVRRVAVTLRVQSAIASLRGPVGPLFARGGTSRSSRIVPDLSVRFQVAPRNLDPGR
jgi:hypothetical protein